MRFQKGFCSPSRIRTGPGRTPFSEGKCDARVLRECETALRTQTETALRTLAAHNKCAGRAAFACARARGGARGRSETRPRHSYNIIERAPARRSVASLTVVSDDCWLPVVRTPVVFRPIVGTRRRAPGRPLSCRRRRRHDFRTARGQKNRILVDR